MGGFVKSTNLMPGNAVRKGQTLAIIENQEFYRHSAKLSRKQKTDLILPKLNTSVKKNFSKAIYLLKKHATSYFQLQQQPQSSGKAFGTKAVAY